MTSTLRLVDPSGVEKLSLSTRTATILNSVDAGYPTVREVSASISGSHGERDTTQYVGARVITANVTLPADPTAAKAAVDTIAGLMNPSLRLYAYLGETGWAQERRTLVRASAWTCAPAQGSYRPGQMLWKAPTGLLEDANPTTVTLVPSASASGGVTFPITFPITFLAGLVPGASLVNVGGNIEATPIIDIYGPCSDPLIRCVDTGDQIVFTGLSIADGDYLRVDMAARTAFLNADPAQSRYSRLDFTTSTWWTLPVGTGIQVVFSPSSASGACQAVMQWRSRWI